MKEIFIKSGFNPDSPGYFTKKRGNSILHVDQFGGLEDTGFWRIWETHPGFGTIYIYRGYIRNEKEWEIVQDLLQI